MSDLTKALARRAGLTNAEIDALVAVHVMGAKLIRDEQLGDRWVGGGLNRGVASWRPTTDANDVRKAVNTLKDKNRDAWLSFWLRSPGLTDKSGVCLALLDALAESEAE